MKLTFSSKTLSDCLKGKFGMEKIATQEPLGFCKYHQSLIKPSDHPSIQKCAFYGVIEANWQIKILGLQFTVQFHSILHILHSLKSIIYSLFSSQSILAPIKCPSFSAYTFIPKLTFVSFQLPWQLYTYPWGLRLRLRDRHFRIWTQVLTFETRDPSDI